MRTKRMAERSRSRRNEEDVGGVTAEMTSRDEMEVEKKYMIDQTSNLISSAGFPLIGGGAIGFGVGYLLKLIKLAFIALGLIALLLGYLEYQKWISVNWVTVENQTSVLMTHAANKIATITQHMNHEIPLGTSVLGFVPGLIAGIYKG